MKIMNCTLCTIHISYIYYMQLQQIGGFTLNEKTRQREKFHDGTNRPLLQFSEGKYS